MNSVGAILGVGLAGIFIGALTMEVIRRKNPKLISNLQPKGKGDINKIKQIFKSVFKREPTEESLLQI